MIRQGAIDEPQVSRSHYEGHYDGPQRWSSYWIQIEQALDSGDGRFLEVGIGNGTVATYLRDIAGKHLTTVDIDASLTPDVVADVADLPFQDKEFACAIACEVLEHMPFERAHQALAELRRVADTAVISVPNAGAYVQLGIWTAFRTRHIRFEMPWLFRRKSVRVSKEHFWELEIEGYPRSRFLEIVTSAGWSVRKEVRNPNNHFHHFFVLK